MRFPRSIAIDPNDPDGHTEYIRGQLVGKQNALNKKPAKHTGGRRGTRKQRGRRRVSRKQRGGQHSQWYIKGYVYGYANPNFKFPRSVQRNNDNREYHAGQYAGKRDRNQGLNPAYTAANIQNGGRRGNTQRGGKAWYEFWKSDEPAEDVPPQAPAAPAVPAAPAAPIAPAPMAPVPSPNAPKMRRRKN